MTMTLHTMIPAIRRGMSRIGIAPSRTAQCPRLSGQSRYFPLTREETRLAVIEVLG
jgi:hypothetical protein